MTEEEDIRAYNTIKVDNNLQGVMASLKANGYPFMGIYSRAGMGRFLLAFYYKNKPLYIKTMTSVPYNPNANNYTTDQGFQAQITKLVNEISQ